MYNLDVRVHVPVCTSLVTGPLSPGLFSATAALVPLTIYYSYTCIFLIVSLVLFIFYITMYYDSFIFLQ